jgi:hypothetical protein
LRGGLGGAAGVTTSAVAEHSLGDGLIDGGGRRPDIHTSGLKTVDDFPWRESSVLGDLVYAFIH